MFSFPTVPMEAQLMSANLMDNYLNEIKAGRVADSKRINTRRRFSQFTRTASVLDMRPEEERERAKRLRQAERYEARHGTAGKRSVFA
jgi:hypothetical protein